MFVEGRVACEIGAAGIGMAIGAVASGVSGGTLTAPAMLASGAVGYLFGKVLCKIPAIERGFDQLFTTGDWAALQAAVADQDTSRQTVVLIASETALTEDQASHLWRLMVSAINNKNEALLNNAGIQEARHHPPTGWTKQGLSLLGPVGRGSA